MDERDHEGKRKRCLDDDYADDDYADDDYASGSDSDDDLPRTQNAAKRGKKIITDPNWMDTRMKEVLARPRVSVIAPTLEPEYYESWDSFKAAWDIHLEDNLMKYRARDTTTTDTWNKNKSNLHKIPVSFYHAKITFWCTHGCVSKPRGEGIRIHSYTRFTGCPARMKVEVRETVVDNCRGWRVQVQWQVTEHNHLLSPTLYALYNSRKHVFRDDELLGKITAMAVTNTPMKSMASYVSGVTGLTVNTQQMRNIVANRLGGSNAEARLKKMVADFTAIDGNTCLFVQDADTGLTVALIMQSKSQAEAFARWPETLVMDWTYNTNNLGYHLGALMVTSPTGRGIPVFEFLALSERATILDVIVNAFKDGNPRWTEVEAVIIDKDLKEWRTFVKNFRGVTVFLCQFHVVRAIRRALAEARFALPKDVRDEVEELFVEMIYSRRESIFRSHLHEFRLRLRSLEPRLTDYFEKNWIKIYPSWSNVGRANHFSCGNSTTNRVESNWTQVKAVIGAKTGIDKCFSALMQHQVSVFRGLQAALVKAATSSRSNIGVPPFLRSIGAVASDFVLDKLTRQWEFMLVNKSRWSVTALVPFFVDSQSQESQGPILENQFVVSYGDVRYTVNCAEWTCTCFFAVSLRLPCQHIMYICKTNLHQDRLPAYALPVRWNMNDAVSLDSAVGTNIAKLAELTFCTPQLVLSTPAVAAPDDLPAPSRKPKVQYVQLGSRKKSGRVVLSPRAKQMIATEIVEEGRDAIARSSSSCFDARCEVVRQFLHKMAVQWAMEDAEKGPAVVDEDDDDGEDEDGDEDQCETMCRKDDGVYFQETDGKDVPEFDGEDEDPCIVTDSSQDESNDSDSEMAGVDESYQYDGASEQLRDCAEDLPSRTAVNSSTGPDPPSLHHSPASQQDQMPFDPTAGLPIYPTTGLFIHPSADLPMLQQVNNPVWSFPERLHPTSTNEQWQMSRSEQQDMSTGEQHQMPLYPTTDVPVYPTADLPSYPTLHGFDSPGSEPVRKTEALTISVSQSFPRSLLNPTTHESEHQLPLHDVPLGSLVRLSENQLSQMSLSELELSMTPPPGRRHLPALRVDSSSSDDDPDGTCDSSVRASVPENPVRVSVAPLTNRPRGYLGLRPPSGVAFPPPRKSVLEVLAAAEEEKKCEEVKELYEEKKSEEPNVRQQKGAWSDSKMPTPTKGVQRKDSHSKRKMNRLQIIDVTSECETATLGLPEVAQSVAAKKKAKAKAKTKSTGGKSTSAVPVHKFVGTKQPISAEEWGIPLPDFVYWAERCSGLARVTAIIPSCPHGAVTPRHPTVIALDIRSSDHMHAYTIPFHVMKKLNAALDGKNKTVVIGSNDIETVFVAKMGDEIFTPSYLAEVLTLSGLKSKASHWVEDMAWLKSVGQDLTDSPLVDGLFKLQMFGGVATPISHIIRKVQSAFENASLTQKSIVKTNMGTSEVGVKVVDIIGKIAQRSWISDAIIFATLNFICEDINACYVVDPVYPCNATSTLPDCNIDQLKYLVHAQNVGDSHWIMTIVCITWQNAAATTEVLMYDPMQGTCNHQTMLATWESGTLPFLDRWAHRDHRHSFQIGAPVFQTTPWQETGDFWNCGFLCIVIANSVVNKRPINHSLLSPRDSMTQNDASHLRLRVMHLLLCDAEKEQLCETDEERIKFAATDARLRDLFG